MPFVFGKGGVARHIQAVKDRVPKLLRSFGVEFYRQVTIATPVDTGRARYSWTCAVDRPDFTITAPAPDGWEGQSSGGAAYYSLDATRAANYFTPDKVHADSTIYVANALPYIEKLNNGYSRQAPARFVELAFENAVGKLFKHENKG